MNNTGLPDDAVVVGLPFVQGRWLVQNSPASRVPSHDTTAFGSTYSIDFVPVDDNGRSAPRTWRSVVTTEAPDRFVGFGRPIHAPVSGTVVIAHNSEADTTARRSPFTLLPYALTQPRRARNGPAAIAGNHVVIAITDHGPYVLIAHLRRGTVRVHIGDTVTVSEQIAECGNSGNSTEPHVHLQVVGTTDWAHATGLPIMFRHGTRHRWVPVNGEIVQP